MATKPLPLIADSRVSVIARRGHLGNAGLDVSTPTDDRADFSETEHEEGYGRIVVHAGSRARETYSTSRREIVTLLLEAAGNPIPEWSDSQYPGYPHPPA
jgi:hypothetical protein